MIIAGSLLLALGAATASAQAQDRRSTPAEARSRALSGTASTPDEDASNQLRNKLTGIVLPRVEFRSTTLSSAVEYLRQESARFDPDPEPSARGINLILRVPPAPLAGTTPPDGAAAVAVPTEGTRITLSLTRIPLLEALKYVASQAGLKLKIEPYAVSLVPLTDNTETMIVRTFRIPPNLISNVSDVGKGTALDQPAAPAQ